MKTVKLPEGAFCALPAGCFIALGCFDGVHIGHAALLRASAGRAEDRRLPLAVWSPVGAKAAPQILASGEKRRKLASAGVRFYAEESFDRIRDLSSRAFFEEYLIGKCRASALSCGENFTFGKDAGGNVGTLVKFCAEKGLFLYVQPSVLSNGKTVSSASIRELLKRGEIARANSLLGEPFGFCAQAQTGRGVGKRIGFPTVNLPLPDGFLPPCGVYAAKVRKAPRGISEEADLYAVVNVGVHPTFEKAEKPLCEAHLLSEFRGFPVGSRVQVRLIERLRDEIAFASVKELREQIGRDAEEARRLLERS